jgi:hypothetical protein
MSKIEVNEISKTSTGSEIIISSPVSMDSPLKVKVYTTSQINGLTPSQGQIVFDSDEAKLKVYDGSAWQLVGGADFSAVGENIIPSADVTYDLGSNSYKWRDLYLSGSSIYLGDQTITSDSRSISLSGSLKLKQYTTSQIDALTGMTDGEMVYDTDEKKIKTYNGTDSAWEKITSAGSFSATGGTISTDGSYTLHTFTSSGTFTVQSGSKTCNVYVIGGGGSGGTDGGASSSMGGAGGGLAYKQIDLSVTGGSGGAYTVTVGAGGALKTTDGTGNTGGTSTFDTLQATGGSGGAETTATTTPASGGVGTGGTTNGTGGTGGPGKLSGNNGTAGGNGTNGAPGGGGGGADDDSGGDGGNGDSTYYTGGGGGGGGDSRGAGSQGGAGGTGYYTGGTGGGDSGAGTAGGGSYGGAAGNTGSSRVNNGGGGAQFGGGGGGMADGHNASGANTNVEATGGAGGSGAVIIKYLTEG